MSAEKINTASTARSSVGRIPDSRQAVVIIHGMGEQRPMATMRAMIRAIWDYNPKIILPTAPDEDENTGKSDQQIELELEALRKKSRWVAPSPFSSDADASHELMKITTAKHLRKKPPGKPDEMRTDFFEFYWADILSSTQLRMIIPWLKTLVLRSPHSVPPHAFAIWLAIWISLILGAYLLILLASAAIASLPGEMAIVTSPIKTFVNSGFYKISGIVIAVLFLAFLIAWYVASWIGVIGEAAPHSAGFRQKIVRYGQGFMFATVIITIGLAIFMLLGGKNQKLTSLLGPGKDVVGPMVSDFNPSLLPLSILSIFSLIALYIIITQFFVPYFGDVALYVRSTPSTIENRKQIRQRGLSLLRKLHEDPTYDRIIIVSHSLGSVIAYDLVRLLWSQYGPTSRNGGISKTTAARMDVLARFAKTRSKEKETWSKNDLKKYRSMQKKIFKSLQKTGAELDNPVWKISDLVTLGSPLAHAEFLVETTREELDALLNDRIYPSSPPRKNDPYSNGAEFERYKDGYVYQTEIVDGKTQKIEPAWAIHHAAVFSATRWTNIYDWRSLIIFGDLVSGPVGKLFGQGIADMHVKILNYSRFFFSNSLITHNNYWIWRDKKERAIASSRFAKSDTTSDTYGLPDHLKALQAAVDINFDNDMVTSLELGSEGGQTTGIFIKYLFIILAYILAIVIGSIILGAFFDVDIALQALNNIKKLVITWYGYLIG